MRFLTIVLAVILLAVGCSYPSDAPLHDGEMPYQFALAGLPCAAAPYNPELLDTLGNLALYSGETAEDTAYNKARGSEPLDPCRNSLFLRQRKADGTDEWRVLLTTGSNWRETDGMDEWCSDRARDVKNCFYVWRASLSHDGRHIWLVCDPHTSLYRIAYAYDVYDNTFRYLSNCDDAIEQPDGTILVTGQKFYPKEDDGRGAAWRDVWLTPDGKIVREGEITLRGADL